MQDRAGLTHARLPQRALQRRYTGSFSADESLVGPDGIDRCGACGHDFLVAFSCKGRGLCPSCTTRRMVETAAHLVEHVFPQVPVRQWVVTFPRRLRYFLHREPVLLGRVRRSVLRTIEAALRHRCPDTPRDARCGAVSFVQRFGSALNAHTHLHCCVTDGVFSLDAPRITTQQLPAAAERVQLPRPRACPATKQAV